jgi:UDP-N-acetylmuramoyl-tripeptide--D-alanyl-D-alanine ligase
VEDLAFDLIDDAFNANPASMAAALTMLAEATPGPGGRRVAILGDMLELGPDAVALHAALGAHPAMAQIQTVHCAGPLMAALWEALPRARRGRRADSSEDLQPELRKLVHPGDVVLVKGSKGSRVARLVDLLRNLGQGTQSARQQGR